MTLDFSARSGRDRGCLDGPDITRRNAPIVVTTDSVDERDRFDFWREVVCRSYVEMETRPLDRVDRFSGSIAAMTAGAVQVSRVRLRNLSHLSARTPVTIARAHEHYYVIGLVLDGAGTLVQGEHTAVTRRGDFAMYDTARPYALYMDGDIDMLALRIPQALMSAVMPRAHAATGAVVDGRNGSGSLLAPLLGNLIDTAGSASPAAQRHLATAAVELVAASLAEITALPNDAPLRTASLVRAQQHIEEHLNDPDLSPEDIAHAVFVSLRSLHSIFRDQGTSVARYVMERRLDRAYQELVDPRLAHLRVAEVAARLGFKRASHFTSAFKTRFGVSPREHRGTGGPLRRRPARLH